MMAAMATPNVAVVSGDLLLASRLRAALTGIADVAVVAAGNVPRAELLFIDLNDDADARIALIGELRRRGPGRIIGFCQHDERAVRIRAMEEGADQVVTNGALQEAALRLVGVQAGG
jgi:DNA-binding NarL/FixJ family response regulator